MPAAQRALEAAVDVAAVRANKLRGPRFRVSHVLGELIVALDSPGART